MAEASDRHGKMIDAALRIYRPAMRRYITDTLKGALGDDWYEEWLEQRLDPQREQPQLPKGARPRYEDKQRRVRELKLDPFWLIEVRDFPDIINTREGDFPPEIRRLTGTMRTIAKGSESRAPRQVGPILENCNAVLQAVGGDAAKQIQQLIEAGEPNERREAEVGTFHGSDPQESITRVLKLYRTAMQTYVSTALQSGHANRTGSFNWFQDLVFIDWPDETRGLIKGRLSRGASPKEVIEEAHFASVIRGNQQDFPEELSDGAYDDLFKLAKDARNDFVGHSTPSSPPLPPRVEEVASACVTILTLCRESRFGDKTLDDAMEMIRRIISGKGEPQHSDSSPSPEIANDSPPAQGVGPVSEGDREPDLLRGDDRPEQEQEAYLPDIATLSARDLDARGELESVGREREKRPFFGGVLARLWVGDAARSGSSGGGGAFAAGGEVDEREPVRGRRWKPVAGAILAIIIVALAVLAIVTVSVVSDREGMVDLPEPAVPTPTAGPAQQEQPDDGPPAPEPSTEKDDPPTPLPGTESNGQGGGELPPTGSEQTPSGSAGEGEPSDSGDGGQAEAGGGEQEGAGQAPPDSVGEGEPSDSGDGGQAEAGGGEQEGAGQAPPGGAGGGGTSDSGGGGQTGAGGGEEPERVDCVTDENDECPPGAGGGEETERVDCVTDENDKCPTEAGGAGDGGGNIDPESDAMDDDDGSGIQPGALQEEEPGTTIVTASDSHQAEPPGGGTIDPEDGVMDDDDGSGIQPGALQEEEPGTTIVTADDGNPIVPIVVAEDNPIAFINDDGLQPDALEEEELGTTIVVVDDNPIIVSPAQGAADGDVMEDGG